MKSMVLGFLGSLPEAVGKNSFPSSFRLLAECRFEVPISFFVI